MRTMEIYSRFDSSRVLWSGEAPSVKAGLELAVNGDTDLVGANLWGANLRGAKIANHITLKAVFTINSVDGWPVLLFSTSAGLRLRVGCHLFSLEEAEAHWRGKVDRTHLYALVTEGWKTLVALAGWEELR